MARKDIVIKLTVEEATILENLVRQEVKDQDAMEEHFWNLERLLVKLQEANSAR